MVFTAIGSGICGWLAAPRTREARCWRSSSRQKPSARSAAELIPALPPASTITLFRRLAELGGPRLTSVLTVGGGAANERWGRIRATALGVPLRMPESDEAAVGIARLALRTIGVRSQQ